QRDSEKVSASWYPASTVLHHSMRLRADSRIPALARLHPGYKRSVSQVALLPAFHELLQILQTGLVCAGDQPERAGVTLAFRRVGAWILAGELADPSHGAAAVRIRLDRHRRQIVIDRKRRLDHVVSESHRRLVDGQQFLGEGGTVLDRERTDRATLAVASGHELAFHERRMPLLEAVELLHEVPDLGGRGFDIDGLGHDEHQAVFGE